MRTTLLFLTLAAVPILAAPASAQPSIDVTFGRALAPLASAALTEPAGIDSSRQTTAGSLDLEQRFVGDRLRLFYSLDAGTYNTPGDWSYRLHTAGGTWQATTGGAKRTTLFLGGSATWRANGASWAAADYRGLGAFANVEWRPRPTATLRGGYRFDTRTFPDSAELNQREHGIFTSLLVTLPSRTTLIGEVRAGAKSYAAGMSVTSVVDSAFSATSGAAGSGNGHGPGMGGADRTTLTPAPPWTRSGGSPSHEAARLVSVMGRVAQSLADRTGVSVQYTRRVSSGGLPAAIVTTPALFFEDGIYDDPFASDAQAWRGTLKQVFSNGAQVEAAGTWLHKDYRATSPLNLDGTASLAGVTRADRIWRAGAAWTQPVLRNRTGPIGLDVIVDYWYTEHRSNDAFYNYTSHAFGLGVSVSY